MNILTLMFLALASLLFDSCATETKKAGDSIRESDERRSVASRSHDNIKKPSVNTETAALARSQNDKNEGEGRKQAESATPLDQSATESDLAITRRIRQALVREDLSFAAKNVLVITETDHVVLKGQVRSLSEAERIKGIAGRMTTKRIEDVLEVVP